MNKLNFKIDIEAVDALGKRERTKLANRDAILASAERVFAEIGFKTATVRDIIRGTDLAAGTFYNYFRSKEEVFAALSDDRAERFLPALHVARSQAASLEAYMQRALHAYFIFLEHEYGRGDRTLVERRPYIRHDTPGIQAVYAEVRHGLCEAIRRGLAPPVDADYLASAFIGVAQHVGEAMLLRKPVDIDAATDFALNFVMQGVAGLPRAA